MNLIDNLKKPWVIYAGLGLGVVILLSSRSSSSAPASSTTSGIDYQASMNVAGMNYMQHIYDTAVTFATAQYDADLKTKAIVASAVMTLDQNSTVANTQIANANAGVTNSLIASHTALKLDRQQNDARSYLVGLVQSSASQNLTQITPQSAEQNL